MEAKRRVVVSGLGLVTALGHDETRVWERMLRGETGIGVLGGFETEGNKVVHGAEVDIAVLDARQKGKLRRADRTLRFAVEASRQALHQAGLVAEDGSTEGTRKIGSIWGCGCGPAGTLYESHRRFAEKGPKGMRPSTVPNCMANSISAGVSIEFGLTGTNQVVVTACTSATNAIGQAFRMIRDGYAEQVLCGGVDAFFDPFYYGVWNNLGVLSRIENPEEAVRPFDARRDGTLLGEGGGALLLEAADSARSRGVFPRAEVIGYGESSDASHITSPSVDGQAQAIRMALADAEIEPNAVDFINAHATATEANDQTESESILLALGEAAKSIPVGANKSYFGHTLGASGAIESIVTILGLEAGVVPPNLNLERQDPDCRIAPVGSRPMGLAADIAMKNSFGFGGGNGVLLFSRHEEDR